MTTKPKILIIDDEPDMLKGCSKILSALGNNPVPASDGKQAIDLMREDEFDLVFCDLLMPDFDGMQVLDAVQKLAPNTPVIIFSAYGTIDRAVAAMKAGAFDFIEKPFETGNLKILVEKGLRQRNLFKERISLIRQLEDKYRFDNIIGKSDPMRKVFDMIESVADSEANVLITGESGTGKELIARSIHARSRRKFKPFVPVNCGAFPENLFEAELFGYEKGAFTGATHRKIGLLEYANGGSFFLDEVCELPVNLQIKLLRTLQDQQLRRIGGNELLQADLRLISATNQDISKALEKETIRKDFYYRLNVINIHIPPLRDRDGDIRLLAEHFLIKTVKSSPKNIKGFDDSVIALFESYDWPGNVREMENIVERAVTLAKGEIITLNELPAQFVYSKQEPINFKKRSLSEVRGKAVEEVEKKYFLFLLTKHNGNITHISNEAGMTRRHIHRILKKYNLNPQQFRK
ncbi:MAG TPA: sigma-54 dependent transcriptional regulator [Ignavibacteriaceae bacterium]|nr:sigma-54 dependent transcriptional regulator [Ignavibacteriaceae bacterium]